MKALELVTFLYDFLKLIFPILDGDIMLRCNSKIDVFEFLSLFKALLNKFFERSFENILV